MSRIVFTALAISLILLSASAHPRGNKADEFFEADPETDKPTAECLMKPKPASATAATTAATPTTTTTSEEPQKGKGGTTVELARHQLNAVERSIANYMKNLWNWNPFRSRQPPATTTSTGANTAHLSEEDDRRRALATRDFFHELFPIVPLSGYPLWSDPFFQGVEERILSPTALLAPFDVTETENEYLVHIDLPGVPKEAVTITMKDQMLHVVGERKEQVRTQEKDGMWKTTRSFGHFERHVQLPQHTEPDHIAAKFKDGSLDITIPKKTTAQTRPEPRQIKID